MEEEKKKKSSNREEENMATHTMVTGKKSRRTVNNLKEEKLRPWSDLPQELLELIKKRLLFADQPSFPAVCKSWSSIGNFPPAKQIPWLIVFDETNRNGWRLWSTCKLIDPTSKKTYTIDMKAIKEKKIIIDFNTMKVHESKYGWLLISSQYNHIPHRKTSLFLYSPFYKEKNSVIELPDLYHGNTILGLLATFTSNPLNEDCKFWKLSLLPEKNELLVSTYRLGDEKWYSRSCSCCHIFSVTEVECWTFSEGIFYCASRNAVAKLDCNPKIWKWSYFQKPPPITWYDGGKLHIVKSDGDEELFLIFERNLRTSDKMLCNFVTYIYRLDFSLRIWKKVDRLGDHRVMFIGDGYNCVSKIYGKQPQEISSRLFYCSGFELKFCCLDSVKLRSYDCAGHYGSIATKYCRKLLIDPPSQLPRH